MEQRATKADEMCKLAYNNKSQWIEKELELVLDRIERTASFGYTELRNIFLNHHPVEVIERLRAKGFTVKNCSWLDYLLGIKGHINIFW